MFWYLLVALLFPAYTLPLNSGLWDAKCVTKAVMHWQCAIKTGGRSSKRLALGKMGSQKMRQDLMGRDVIGPQKMRQDLMGMLWHVYIMSWHVDACRPARQLSVPRISEVGVKPF